MMTWTTETLEPSPRRRNKLEFATLDDPQWYSRLRSIDWNCFTFSNHHHAILVKDLPKDHMLSIQPIRRSTRYEELTSVRIRPRIRTRQQPRLVVLVHKVFILERRPIDARSSRSIAIHKVPSLDHETFDDAMKHRTLVADRLFALQELPGTELPKVFARLGALNNLVRQWNKVRDSGIHDTHICGVQLQLDPTQRVGLESDVEKDNDISSLEGSCDGRIGSTLYHGDCRGSDGDRGGSHYGLAEGALDVGWQRSCHGRRGAEHLKV